MNFELPSQRSIAAKIIQIKILIRPFPSFLTTSCASYSSLSRSLSLFPFVHRTSSVQYSSSLKLSLRSSLHISLFQSLIPTYPDVELLFLSLSCDLLVVILIILTLTILSQHIHPESVPAIFLIEILFLSFHCRRPSCADIPFLGCPSLSVCLPDSSCFLVTITIVERLLNFATCNYK